MIYLDNHATTRCDPRVLQRMLPYFSEHYGNAGSKTHAMGWTAAAAVDLAREQVADAILAQSNEIVFCSGATEANSLALQGVARAYADRGKHIVIANTEHASVLDCAMGLEAEGWSVTVVPVQSDGRLRTDDLRAALRKDTTIVSVMLVNNEIGTVQDIAALSAVVHEFDASLVFHCDAAQALGKVPMEVAALGVDLLSLSGHKAHGPKGIGALWRRRRPRLKLAPLIRGGGQEEGLRAGTLPVPLIVGFGEACAIASAELGSESERVSALRDQLLSGLQSRLREVHVNGTMESRVCGNLNLAFDGVLAEQLVLALGDLACSTGAACSSANAKPSHVLQAIVDAERAASSIRLGLGRFTSAEEVETAIQMIVSAVSSLRGK